MACFEVDISYEPVANIITSFKEVINSVIIGSNTNIVSSVETEPQLTTFTISVVCDIDYGIPLYTTDGSVYTIDGVPVYVRRARVSDYT